MSMRLLRRGRRRRGSRGRGPLRGREPLLGRSLTRLDRFEAVVDILALGSLAASVAAQVLVTVYGHSIAVLGRANDHRPQEDHQIGALALHALEAEQRAEKRDLAQKRNPLPSLVQRVLD